MEDSDAPSLDEILQLTLSELAEQTDGADEVADPIYGCGRFAVSLLPIDPGTCSDLAHYHLHAVPYKDVQTCWRRLYVDAALWKAVRTVEGRSGAKLGQETGGNDDDGKVEGEKDQGGEDEDWITKIVKTLDMALIMTGAPRREEVIELWFSALKQYLSSTHHQTQPSDQPSKRRKLSPSIQDPSISCPFSEIPIPNPTLRHPIPRVENPSFSAFQSKLSVPETQTPILIEGAISHWPAFSDPGRQWRNPSYLLSHTLDGRRLVPVELGRAYTDSNWTQKIMSFGEFMRDHMFDSPPKYSTSSNPNSKAPHGNPRKKPTAYLAQHDLLTQLPTLRPDICIPDYCYTSPAPLPGHAPQDSRLPDPLLNAWLGPRGTTSPLHTDPYHNILAQVVGCKYIRLYAPEHSKALWPRGTERGVNMGNTSSIDLNTAMAFFPEIGAGLENRGATPHHNHQPDHPEANAGTRPDVDAQLHGHAEDSTELENSKAGRRRRSFQARFPGFVDAPYRECVLRPGECLYIPAGWWHYVRSLSPSFSVSFWWD